MQDLNFAGTVVTVPDYNLEYSVERLRRLLNYIFFAISGNDSERSQTVPNYIRFLRAIARNGRDDFRL